MRYRTSSPVASARTTTTARMMMGASTLRFNASPRHHPHGRAKSSPRPQVDPWIRARHGDGVENLRNKRPAVFTPHAGRMGHDKPMADQSFRKLFYVVRNNVVPVPQQGERLAGTEQMECCPGRRAKRDIRVVAGSLQNGNLVGPNLFFDPDFLDRFF